jgi:nucleotide-binding universal stress UspA family protein
MRISRILVGHDDSSRAEDAVALARLLSDATGAELVLARVTPRPPLVTSAVTVPEAEGEYLEGQAEQLLRQAASIGARAEIASGSSPARGLHELAEQVGADLVVVGSSHRGRVGQVLAGNVATSLLNGAHRAVAVAPAGYAERDDAALSAIGAGFDGSAEAEVAVRAAGALALATAAEVRVICVVGQQAELAAHPWAFGWGAGETRNAVVEHMRGRVESAAGGLPREVRRSTELLDGGAVSVLADAGRKLDLLVLGSRGYGPLRSTLLGSVSRELVKSVPCPVLVVPRAAQAGPPPGAGSAHDEFSV